MKKLFLTLFILSKIAFEAVSFEISDFQPTFDRTDQIQVTVDSNNENIDSSKDSVGSFQEVKRKSNPINKKLFKKINLIHDTVWLQTMTVKEFKDKLGWRESKNNYQMVNRFGFKGKYAISDYMLDLLTKVSRKEFLENPQEQERVMNESIFRYLRFLKREKLLKYLNREIGGMKITLEMLLAGSHYSPYFLKLFLKSDGRKNDPNYGMTCGDYMRFFSE